MLRDNLVELIEPMLNSAGANPLALTHHQIQASGDRLPCLENPRPKGAESSLTENVTSPFQAEPAHNLRRTPCDLMPIDEFHTLSSCTPELFQTAQIFLSSPSKIPVREDLGPRPSQLGES